jgi:DNA-binding transcriptional LysR family regulator
MDRLQSLRVFRQVAEEGGFAAAARRMDLDPAVVTRLVADLESHLGAALLQRTTRRVSLTPAGENYLARVRAILAEIDEADASVRGQATALRGRLRILSSASVTAHILAPAVKDFLSKYPDIQVDIRTTYGSEPPLEDYDLTFLGAYTTLPADVVTRELTAAVMGLCASPAYLKRHGVPRKPVDLAAHRILRLRRAGESAERLRLINPDEQDREEIIDTQPTLVSDTAEIVLRAALDGAGITSLSYAIASPYIQTGALRAVLPPWITNRVSVLAIYPSRKSLAARARVFLDHIVATLEGTPPAPRRAALGRRVAAP